MKKIYVDYAATTPLDPDVLDAMKPYFTRIYGNASSINTFGVEARDAVEDARKTVSELMNAEPENVVFTGSATEANNMILKGFAFKQGKKKTHIAISTIEHDSIRIPAKWLEKRGYNTTIIPVDNYGSLELKELENALKKGVSLVSMIHANNEVGTIQQLTEIEELCHKYGAYIHTDAAQSFGKLSIDVKDMNVDFMTVNAHKIYGPKGVGALYIKEKEIIEPLLHGGGHESGLRSGTENVPGIVGFARAAELRKKEMVPEAHRLESLRDYLEKEVLEIQDTFINGHPSRRLPNIANFRFSYIEGESLLLALSDEDVAASTGSACSSKHGEPSHVLLALGLKPEETHGSLRISLGKYTTREDINHILQVLPITVEKLRKLSPLKR